MSVNIDTVYQRVLNIANKEQRGYITPQEFNLFANQAQMDIFEQYFYDLNQFSRIQGNDSTYSDMVSILQEKIDVFEKFRQNVSMSSGGVGTLPSHYRMGELYYNNSGSYVEIEKLQQNELHHYINSPLTTPSVSLPIYVNTSASAIQVYPVTITSGVTCNYIARPATVKWAYTVVFEQAMYNSNNSVNFELHESEETELVIKILSLAGVMLKDPNMYQIASTEDQKSIQQEKQ
jgi:hypothetical protein